MSCVRLPVRSLLKISKTVSRCSSIDAIKIRQSALPWEQMVCFLKATISFNERKKDVLVTLI